ncbi:hypothetical protein THASP1DRAFT_27499 [Thamnocephalis sphaerospora]|uniref:Glutamate/phenylalanine/leucine/valine/L-tryptophan dehydrogenase C-terminal domain-containing protein n=1 Tax=Thamnocephalis sphaerospora TaxID=78915 RepID=A0A4P9XYC0_9FUNG|nr:hypothetical protein THASP1DRAFT_27499 [Thamnocephalis sphaerospora]|eukprot:RKP10701.1 hypothetical protein THASP1DRAFT_27499 [Thamnocephalis sphaerospora]
MTNKPDILLLTLDAFLALLRAHGITTFHFVLETSTAGARFVASHPLLQPLADYFFHEATDFEGHEGVFAQGAFVHRTCRGPAAGGVRNWSYDTVEAWFRDGLRLGKGMTHKNALAEIWWGGGKGVMARNTGCGLRHEDTAEERQTVYEEYGAFMSALNGCYVTAEDVGTSGKYTLRDMKALFSQTRFTTCIPTDLGGSGNPSVPTARGVIRGIEAAFDHLGKQLAGSTVAVQGVGHVGLPLIEFLLSKNVQQIIAADVDTPRLKTAATYIQQLPRGDRVKLQHVKRGDLSILFTECDVVCPCATGGILSIDTIPKIRAPIVCGAANNQLASLDTDAKLLKKHGICYVPDFLVNRMGIVQCADEAAGYVSPDPNIEKHLGNEWSNAIYNLARSVLCEADATGKTSQEIALKVAEERSYQLHPIWGHRSKDIIYGLEALTEAEREFRVDPYASILESPLRLCLYTRRMQPSALMIRFIRAQDASTGRIWLVSDGVGTAPKRSGLGKWITARRPIIRRLVRERFSERLAAGAYIRPDIDEHIACLMRDDIVAKFTRLCRSTVLWWMREHSRAKKIRAASSQDGSPAGEATGASASLDNVQPTPGEPHPRLFLPQAHAPFARLHLENNATPPWRIDGRLAACYMTLPPVLENVAAEDGTISPSSSFAGNVQTSSQHLPHHDLGRLLESRQLHGLRTALGLRRHDQRTFTLALMATDRTQPLAMALWKLQQYES